MKKLALTVAVVLAMGLNRGVTFDKQEKEGGMMKDGPNLPGHGDEGDQNGPLGSGVAVLLGLGAAYLIGKKRNEK